MLPLHNQYSLVESDEKLQSPLAIPHKSRQRLVLRLKQLLSILVVLCFLYLFTLASNTGVRHRQRNPTLKVQANGLQQTQLSKERARNVTEAFKFAYHQYSTHAWGKDEIMPISLMGKDSRNGWGATIIDALSTLHIMQLQHEFDLGVEFACNIDFSDSRIPGEAISVFETTIRYLGGILSAYELSGYKHPCLLKKAQELGDKLVYAWPDGSPYPFPELNFTTNTPIAKENKTCIAEAGSSIIEFDRLSHFTGNDTYYKLAHMSSSTIMSNPHDFPGLHAQEILLEGDAYINRKVGWGPGIDSFLEYGLKYWLLVGDKASEYMQYWRAAVSSSMQHLLHESRDGRMFLYEHSGYNGSQLVEMSHLSCFAPGNWMLGSKILGDDATFNMALRLAETCAYSYEAMKSGIGPEIFYDDDGKIYPLNQKYYLRPEVMESIWYAWRLTGDPIWQERGWAVFQSFEEHCRNKGGYTELEGVSFEDPTVVNSSQSFLFSELLKYFYLLFAPPEVLSLEEYVLSTEGHPFKMPQK